MLPRRHRRPSALRRPAAVVALLTVALLLSAARHPQDGPDADLRYVLGDDSVRATVVLNLAFVDGALDLPRENQDTLAEVELPYYRDAVAELLAERCPVTVDGEPVPGRVVDFAVEHPDPDQLSLFPNYGARALLRLRWIVEHPLPQAPSRIGLAWTVFPRQAAWGPGGADQAITLQARLAVPGEELLLTFSEDEPGYTWHRGDSSGPDVADVPPPAAPRELGLHLVPLAAGAGLLVLLWRGRRQLTWALPLAAAVSWLGWDLAVLPLPGGGPPLPDEAAARAVFEPLHANVYAAFEHTSESAIYDALALCVEGDLLEELYEQVYRGLVMAEEGGAVSRVAAVRVLALDVLDIGHLEPDGLPGFRVETTWQVDGVVHHWGHSHERTNEYTARYTVRAGDQGWRLASSEVLAQRRLSGTPIDPVEPAGAPPVFQLPPGEDL